MAKIDIRTTAESKIDAIIVDDELEIVNDNAKSFLITDPDSQMEVFVNHSSVDNLIKALQKVKQLGWDKGEK